MRPRPKDFPLILALAAVVALALVLILRWPLEEGVIERAAVLATILLSGTLVAVTYTYTRETTRIADESNKQSKAIEDQLNLDLVPKLIATLSNHPQLLGGPKSITFIVFNLSRHPMWIDSVTILDHATLAYRDPADARGGRELKPGDRIEYSMQHLETQQPRFRFRYYYGPTADKLHDKAWIVFGLYENRKVIPIEGDLDTEFK